MYMTVDPNEKCMWTQSSSDGNSACTVVSFPVIFCPIGASVMMAPHRLCTVTVAMCLVGT